MVIDFHYHNTDNDELITNLIISMDRAGVDRTMLLGGYYWVFSIYKPDWKKVFKPEAIREVLHKMLHPDENE